MHLYARIGIKYYVIHDPDFFYGKKEIRVFKLAGNHYQKMQPYTGICLK